MRNLYSEINRDIELSQKEKKFNVNLCELNNLMEREV